MYLKKKLVASDKTKIASPVGMLAERYWDNVYRRSRAYRTYHCTTQHVSSYIEKKIKKAIRTAVPAPKGTYLLTLPGTYYWERKKCPLHWASSQQPLEKKPSLPSFHACVWCGVRPAQGIYPMTTCHPIKKRCNILCDDEERASRNKQEVYRIIRSVLSYVDYSIKIFEGRQP